MSYCCALGVNGGCDSDLPSGFFSSPCSDWIVAVIASECTLKFLFNPPALTSSHRFYEFQTLRLSRSVRSLFENAGRFALSNLIQCFQMRSFLGFVACKLSLGSSDRYVHPGSVYCEVWLEFYTCLTSFVRCPPRCRRGQSQ